MFRLMSIRIQRSSADWLRMFESRITFTASELEASSFDMTTLMTFSFWLMTTMMQQNWESCLSASRLRQFFISDSDPVCMQFSTCCWQFSQSCWQALQQRYCSSQSWVRGSLQLLLLQFRLDATLPGNTWSRQLTMSAWRQKIFDKRTIKQNKAWLKKFSHAFFLTASDSKKMRTALECSNAVLMNPISRKGNAPRAARTLDSQIKSLVLYQLSYRSIFAWVLPPCSQSHICSAILSWKLNPVIVMTGEIMHAAASNC